MKKARGYFEALGSMLSCAYRVDSALVGRDREEAFITASAVNLPISHYFFFLYSFYLLFVEKAARETGRSFLLLPKSSRFSGNVF